MINFPNDNAGSPDYMRGEELQYCIECGTEFEVQDTGRYTGLCYICYDKIKEEENSKK